MNLALFKFSVPVPTLTSDLCIKQLSVGQVFLFFVHTWSRDQSEFNRFTHPENKIHNFPCSGSHFHKLLMKFYPESTVLLSLHQNILSQFHDSYHYWWPECLNSTAFSHDWSLLPMLAVFLSSPNPTNWCYNIRNSTKRAGTAWHP